MSDQMRAVERVRCDFALAMGSEREDAAAFAAEARADDDLAGVVTESDRAAVEAEFAGAGDGQQEHALAAAARTQFAVALGDDVADEDVAAVAIAEAQDGDQGEAEPADDDEAATLKEMLAEHAQQSKGRGPVHRARAREGSAAPPLSAVFAAWKAARAAA